MAELWALTSGFQGKIGPTRARIEPWWPEAGAPQGRAQHRHRLHGRYGLCRRRLFWQRNRRPTSTHWRHGTAFQPLHTHPICSPARAALLTGRNAACGGNRLGCQQPRGFPGYSGALPLDAATLAETLRAQGYTTIMVGKWHNTPNYLTLPSSPKDSWPSQRGFDYFYGFLGGETNFFFPARLMLGNALLTNTRTTTTPDDWTDKAIGFVREVRTAAPEQPSSSTSHAGTRLQAKPRISASTVAATTGWTPRCQGHATSASSN